MLCRNSRSFLAFSAAVLFSTAAASAEFEAPTIDGFAGEPVYALQDDGPTTTAAPDNDGWTARLFNGRRKYLRAGGFLLTSQSASAGIDDAVTSQFGQEVRGVTVGSSSTFGFQFAGGLHTDYDDLSGRFELELSYASADGDFSSIIPAGSVDSDFNLLNVMANGYVFIADPDAKWAPYIGGGVGVSRVSYSDEIFGDRSSINPAFQLMGGIEYRINERFRADVGARYFNSWVRNNEIIGDTYFLDAGSFHISLTMMF